MAAVRAIADTLEQEVPCDFEAALDATGQIRLRRILVQMIQQPLKLASLLRFGVASRRATTALTHYLDRFIEALALQECLQDSPLAAAQQ